MAVNFSHVRRVANGLIAIAEEAANAIENKDKEGENDAARIDAYMQLKDQIEEALDELESELDQNS